VVRLSFGAGINFVALEKLKHFMLDVLPHASGQLGYLQAAAVGGEGDVTQFLCVCGQLLLYCHDASSHA
jgi:hypothetical protein